MIEATDTEWAPWYIVPSDHKWYRNLVISQALIECLESCKMRYPDPPEGLENISFD